MGILEVRLAVAPPKTIKNYEKLICETKIISEFLFFCYFDVFNTTKRRLRLNFLQHILLDLTQRPARPKICTMNFF